MHTHTRTCTRIHAVMRKHTCRTHTHQHKKCLMHTRCDTPTYKLIHAPLWKATTHIFFTQVPPTYEFVLADTTLDTCSYLLIPAHTCSHLLTPTHTCSHLLTPAYTCWYLLIPALYTTVYTCCLYKYQSNTPNTRTCLLLGLTINVPCNSSSLPPSLNPPMSGHDGESELAAAILDLESTTPSFAALVFVSIYVCM